MDDKGGRRSTVKGGLSETMHVKEKKKINPADELERELKKSGLSRTEFNY